MPSPHRILLRNGTLLIHTPTNDHIVPTKADLLIEGNNISKIGPALSVEEGTEVIDCEGKVVSPGFVDTHHHVWQTQLKGRHANEVLVEYFVSGWAMAAQYSDPDIYLGQLSGCLEMLSAGTTTVLDHSHVNVRPTASTHAISATASSGIRSIYAYTPTVRIESWQPFKPNPSILEEGWVMETLGELAAKAPFGEGRVEVGFGFDAYWMGEEYVKKVFKRVKKAGVRLVTSHMAKNACFGFTPLPMVMEGYGLLDERVVLSHATGCTAEEAEVIRKNGASVSSTPSTEMQMALGLPVCFDDSLGLQKHSSLGIDCHSNNSSSIVQEMRLVLQSAREMYNLQFLEKKKQPKTVGKTVEEAFNLGTIQGARALKMDDRIGSIAEGKLADLVIFDATSPAMVCAAEHDPVAAIVLHSSPSDIDTVVVDGIVRQSGGKLKNVKLDEVGKAAISAAGDELDWRTLAKELLASRQRIQKNIDKLDLRQGLNDIMQMFYMDPANLVDGLSKLELDS